MQPTRRDLAIRLEGGTEGGDAAGNSRSPPSKAHVLSDPGKDDGNNNNNNSTDKRQHTAARHTCRRKQAAQVGLPSARHS
jgi:hypothetical protein